jgi:hypothetical protein
MFFKIIEGSSEHTLSSMLLMLFIKMGNPGPEKFHTLLEYSTLGYFSQHQKVNKPATGTLLMAGNQKHSNAVRSQHSSVFMLTRL